MYVPDPVKTPSGWRIQLRLGGVSYPIVAADKKKCIKLAEAQKAAYRAGLAAKKTAPITLESAIDAYINAKQNLLSPATIRGYDVIKRNRLKSTMKRNLSAISDKEWQKIINQESTKYSPKTIKNTWGLISSAASFSGVTLPSITLPASIKHDAEFLTHDQILVFVKAVAGTKHELPLLLALSAMRISEIDALRWENIPEKAEFVQVKGAVVMNKEHKMVYKEQNKNITSSRKVPILIPELSQALERERNESGKVLACAQNTLRRALTNLCNANGLPDVGLHGLRHSFASLAYHLQIPEKIAMEIGGWADDKTMRNIYTHIAQSDISRYKTAISAFYSGGMNK